MINPYKINVETESDKSLVDLVKDCTKALLLPGYWITTAHQLSKIPDHNFSKKSKRDLYTLPTLIEIYKHAFMGFLLSQHLYS